MVIVFNINKRRDLIKAINGLDRVGKIMPKLGSQIIRKWGLQMEKDLKATGRQAGITKRSGGLLDNGIQYRQKKNGRTGKLFIRKSGILVDGMNAHYVNVQQSRGRLLQWALRARSKSIRTRAQQIQEGKGKKFPILVRPHPFIQQGIRRASNKFGAIMNQEIKKEIKNVKN